jgi:hypothetical protein
MKQLVLYDAPYSKDAVEVLPASATGESIDTMVDMTASGLGLPQSCHHRFDTFFCGKNEFSYEQDVALKPFRYDVWLWCVSRRSFLKINVTRELWKANCPST